MITRSWVSKMSQVLSNLTGNALRHTPPGGRVTLSAARQSGAWIVQVDDTGEGIQANDLPHIFDRFYRGIKSRNRSTGGSGLGLAIVHDIIAAHGGTITVESRPDQGTRFQLSIPG